MVRSCSIPIPRVYMVCVFLECPEEPVDNRCLYDKLEEQKQKKQEEYEEQFAFSKFTV